jgi:type VI secretion system protein ImpL
VIGAKPDPAALNEPLRELKALAATLPPSIGALVAQAYERSTGTVRVELQDDLRNRYEQEVVGACREVVSGNYPFDPVSRTDAPIADITRIFGAAGTFDTFFRSHLETLVDTSQAPWRWKVDVTGAEVGGSRDILRKFEAARRIRDDLFSASQAGPSARFNLTPAYLDQKTLKLVVDVDAQRLEYSHGPRVPKQVSWPGQTAGAASVTFEDGAAVRPTREFKGEWALFRLLDTAHVEPESATRYQVTFQMAGHEARLVLDALSVRNPFGSTGLQQFRCEL